MSEWRELVEKMLRQSVTEEARERKREKDGGKEKEEERR